MGTKKAAGKSGSSKEVVKMVRDLLGEEANFFGDNVLMKAIQIVDSEPLDHWADHSSATTNEEESHSRGKSKKVKNPKRLTKSK